MSGPSFSNVKLLCHFDGTNGQTTTVDSSSNARSITRISSTLSTTQVKFGTTSSNSTGGTACWQCADSADWAFGNGQFTVEAWVYFTFAPGSNLLSVISQWAGSSNLGWFFGMVSGNLAFYYSTSGTDNPNVGATWTPSTNTWYHIAVDRDASNVLRVYVDGVVKASGTVSATFFDSSRTLDVVGSLSGFAGITGYVDEVRITKGEAVYGGAFTPPTGPFPDGGSVDAAASESATAADTSDGVRSTAAAISESASASDSNDALKALGAIASESTSASDANDALVSLGGAASESASSSEASNAILDTLAASSELATATDAATASCIVTAAATEALSASESSAPILTAVAAISEAATAVAVADSVAGPVGVIAEALSATDVISAQLATMALAAEAVSANDGPSAVVRTPASVAESVTASDTAAAIASLVAANTEAASASDFSDFAGSTVATITEAATATSVENASRLVAGSLTEAAAALDLLSVIANLHDSVIETAFAADAGLSGFFLEASIEEITMADEFSNHHSVFGHLTADLRTLPVVAARSSCVPKDATQ